MGPALTKEILYICLEVNLYSWKENFVSFLLYICCLSPQSSYPKLFIALTVGSFVSSIWINWNNTMNPLDLSTYTRLVSRAGIYGISTSSCLMLTEFISPHDTPSLFNVISKNISNLIKIWESFHSFSARWSIIQYMLPQQFLICQKIALE